MRTLKQAAAWVGKTGLALVYGKADVVLPSLMEAICGPGPVQWAIRDDDGRFVSFTPEMGRLWKWKDELPQKRLACAGRHLARSAVLVAPRLLPALYAARFDDEELTPLEREVTDVVDAGPASAPEIRRLLGTSDTKSVNKAIERLQRRLILTNAGVTDQEQGWAAIVQDVFARRWAEQLRELPPRDDARRSLAGAVLDVGGEVSAADVAAVLELRRRKEVATLLDELCDLGVADARDEDGIRLWRQRSRRSTAARRMSV